MINFTYYRDISTPVQPALAFKSSPDPKIINENNKQTRRIHVGIAETDYIILTKYNFKKVSLLNSCIKISRVWFSLRVFQHFFGELKIKDYIITLLCTIIIAFRWKFRCNKSESDSLCHRFQTAFISSLNDWWTRYFKINNSSANLSKWLIMSHDFAVIQFARSSSGTCGNLHFMAGSRLQVTSEN